MSRLVILLLGTLLLFSCGYKPTAHSVKSILGDKVYIDVQINQTDPESSVYIKDKLISIFYNRFHATLAPKTQATSRIVVSYGATISPLSYDSNGFVNKYSINLGMVFRISSQHKANFVKAINSRYESDIQESGKNQSILRLEAIQKGVEIALDEFVAYLAIMGAKQ